MKNKDNLVSIRELQQQVKASKLFTFLMTKEQREQRNELEKKINQMINQIDLFTARFSKLGWCAYDSMNVPLMEKANKTYDIEGEYAAERVLIDYYKSDVKEILHWIPNKSTAFSLRKDLLQNAFNDHFEGRYYASVPLFLMIVDGAVNDFTKAKGFFAEGTDVTAWDCLVGCSESLENLKQIFNKGRGKTNSEEIKMPYRNGILHGRDLNYGNEYVSCKCVALLFAVADWMSMKNSEDKRKTQYQKEHEPISIIDAFQRIRQNKVDIKDIGEWKKREVVIGKDIPEYGDVDAYEDYPYIVPVIQFTQYWKQRNYGMLGKLPCKLFSNTASEGKRAGEARQLFENKILESCKIIEVEERGCGSSKVVVSVTWDNKGQKVTGNLVFGVIYDVISNEQKEVALPWKENGRWVIYPWDVGDLYKR